MIQLPQIDNKSILTPTCGFLSTGYTHTINPYSGCSFASSCCGLFCYVQHSYWITKGRDWAFYGVKRNIRDAYRREYDRIKYPKRGNPTPLRIYCASSTDPYMPQEKHTLATRTLLEEMQVRPPDALVLQTRSPLIERDLDLIVELSRQCRVWVSMTVENDRETIPGLPPHAHSPVKRLATLKVFREAGVSVQATVSPMFAIENVTRFAETLGESCDRVICDHYLLGDGSKHGLRTKRTRFPELLEAHGFGEWNKLDKFYEVVDTFRDIIGRDRVLLSAEGFNTI